MSYSGGGLGWAGGWGVVTACDWLGKMIRELGAKYRLLDADFRSASALGRVDDITSKQWGEQLARYLKWEAAAQSEINGSLLYCHEALINEGVPFDGQADGWAGRYESATGLKSSLGVGGKGILNTISDAASSLKKSFDETQSTVRLVAIAGLVGAGIYLAWPFILEQRLAAQMRRAR